jgi:hypothetical protein
MVVVAVVLVAVLTFVIAAWAIGREARRLGTQRLMPVYRLEEAVDDVAASLPYDVAAAVSRADLTMVLREHINLVQFAEGAAADVDAANPLLLEGESVVAAVYRRTRADGLDLTRPQVDAMVAGHIGYLAAIGAITTVE